MEPLPRRLRAGDRARGRGRRADVGLRRVLVRVPGRRPDRLHGVQRRLGPARGDRAAASCATSSSSSRASSTSPPTGAAAYFAAASPTREACVVAVDVDSGETELLAGSEEPAHRPGLRLGRAPARVRDDDDKTAHALFYAPHNPDHTAPAGERPPLLVRVHGGPTAHVTARLDREIQFFTIARLRGRRRQLRRQHRLRARVPRAPARPVGHRRRRRRRQRRARAGRGGRGRPRAPGDHRRLGRRLDGAVRGGVPPRRVRRRRRLLRRLGPDGLRRRHPQVRVPLQRLARRPLARGGRPVARRARR